MWEDLTKQKDSFAPDFELRRTEPEVHRVQRSQGAGALKEVKKMAIVKIKGLKIPKSEYLGFILQVTRYSK